VAINQKYIPTFNTRSQCKDDPKDGAGDYYPELMVSEIHYSIPSSVGTYSDYQFVEIYRPFGSPFYEGWDGNISGFKMTFEGTDAIDGLGCGINVSGKEWNRFEFPDGTYIQEGYRIVIANNATTYESEPDLTLGVNLFEWQDGDSYNLNRYSPMTIRIRNNCWQNPVCIPAPEYQNSVGVSETCAAQSVEYFCDTDDSATEETCVDGNWTTYCDFHTQCVYDVPPECTNMGRDDNNCGNADGCTVNVVRYHTGCDDGIEVDSYGWPTISSCPYGSHGGNSIELKPDYLLWNTDINIGSNWQVSTSEHGTPDSGIIFGCTDPQACNFDALATDDDGGCDYSTTIQCCFDEDLDLSWTEEQSLEGCYPSCSTLGEHWYNCEDLDGSEILGCTDECAINYNPEATQHIDNCEYQVFSAGEIIIDEIHYYPVDGNDAEFFEIYNNSTQDLNLSCVSITTQGASSEFVRLESIPVGTQISSGGRVVFANNSSVYDGVNGLSVNQNLFEITGNLNNTTPMTIRLKTAVGDIINEVRYQVAGNEGSENNTCSGIGTEWPSNVYNDDTSIVLVNHSLDNNCGTNWRRGGGGPTPGLSNEPKLNTSPADLFISEIMYNPPGGGEREYFELYNNHPSITFDISGFEWDGVNPVSSDDNYIIPNGVHIAPNEVILFTRKHPIDEFDISWSGQDNPCLVDTQQCYPYGGTPNRTICCNGRLIQLRATYGNVVARWNGGTSNAPFLNVDETYPETDNLGSSVEYKIFCDEDFNLNPDCTEDCKNGSSYTNGGNTACWQASIDGGNPGYVAQSIVGCMDPSSCNYCGDCTTHSQPMCEYPDVNYDCDGNCVIGEDCNGVCGGTAELDCAGVCDGNSVYDACGVCDGPGAIYECGCSEIPEGTCDCAGNVLDECNICGGDNLSCSGCTDADALNYDQDATIDDGTCQYIDLPDCECLTDSDCENICAAEGGCGECVSSGCNASSMTGLCECFTCLIEGCTDIEACNYDSEAQENDGSCVYATDFFNCDGDCIVEIDCLGECGGDAEELECGCNTPMADGACNCDGYIDDCAGVCGGDASIDNNGECCNANLIDDCGICNGDSSSCAPSGDILIESTLTFGLSQHQFTFTPLGDSPTGAWSAPSDGGYIVEYLLEIDRKTSDDQTGPSGLMTVNRTFDSETEILDFEQNGYFKEFTIQSDPLPYTYFVKITATDNNGIIGSHQKIFIIENIIETAQSVSLSYLPYQGIWLYGNYDPIAIPLYQTRASMTNYDVDRRPQLGTFYYIDDNFNVPWVQKINEISLSYDNPEDFYSGTEFDLDDIGMLQSQSGKIITPWKSLIQSDLSPDIDARTVRSLNKNVNQTVYNYFDELIQPDEYDINSAPGEVQLYAYFRRSSELSENLNEVSCGGVGDSGHILVSDAHCTKASDCNTPDGSSFGIEGQNVTPSDCCIFHYGGYPGDYTIGEPCGSFGVYYGYYCNYVPTDLTGETPDVNVYDIFNDRPHVNFDYINRDGIVCKMDSDWTTSYFTQAYIGVIDWGDSVTAIPEYADKPLELKSDTIIKHKYEKPGVYEITGLMFIVGGILIEGSRHKQGVLESFKFTTRINLYENNLYTSPFIDVNAFEPIIGGISKNSIYYKTIKRQLGLMPGLDQPIDLHFAYEFDRLETGGALVNIENRVSGSSAPSLPFLDDYMGPTYDLSDASGAPTESATSNNLIHNGRFNDQGILGEFPGELDIGQIRYFNSGKYNIWDMLGFINTPFEQSYGINDASITQAVLFTAAHNQRSYRPSIDSTHSSDLYTGSIGRKMHDFFGCPVIYAKYRTDDPNFYHYVPDPTDTPAFEPIKGKMMPMKRAVLDYLETHPNIKLVIDLHGAANWRYFAVDLGLTGPKNTPGPFLTDEGEWEEVESPELQYPQYNVFDDVSKYAPSIKTTFGTQELLRYIYDALIDNGVGAGCPTSQDEIDTSTCINHDNDGFGPTFNHSFTAGNQPTGTAWVTRDAPSEIVTNPDKFVDAVQMEFSREYRRFGNTEDNDPAALKAIVDIVNFTNEHYGYIDAIKPKPTDIEFENWGPWIKNDWDTQFDPTKDTVLSADTVPMLNHPGNPGHSRYWKNIIPKDTNIFTGREGIVAYNIGQTIIGSGSYTLMFSDLPETGVTVNDIFSALLEYTHMVDFILYTPTGEYFTELSEYPSVNNDDGWRITIASNVSIRFDFSYYFNIYTEDELGSIQELYFDDYSLLTGDLSSNQNWTPKIITENVGEQQSTEYINYYQNFYYPVLPKIDFLGRFSENRLQTFNSSPLFPWGYPGIDWNEYDPYASITNEKIVNNNLNIDMTFSEIDDNNQLIDIGGRNIFGQLITDYKVMFDHETGEPYANDFKIYPKLGEDEYEKPY